MGNLIPEEIRKSIPHVGLEVERDLYFKPTPLSTIKASNG